MRPEEIIHQRFCAEFTKLCKEKGKIPANEIPEAVAILKAIDVLEAIYPNLTSDSV